MKLNCPKIIWMYWDQGFENAPFVVKNCVAQCKKLHPDWTIYLLDKHSVKNFLTVFPISKKKYNQLLVQHKSDLIRTQLLIKYGGVWVDPTCYFIRPLDEWLYKYLKTDYFFFYKPGPGRLIANWFIAAKPGSKMLIQLYNELCYYWENNTFKNFHKTMVYEKFFVRFLNRSCRLSRIWFSKPFIRIFAIFPYMVYHFKFYDIISGNSSLRKEWNIIPKFSADTPHYIQNIGMLKYLSDDVKSWIDDKNAPLVKLNWKVSEIDVFKGSILNYLFFGS